MSRFIVNETLIAGLKVIKRQPTDDSRGFFERLFCQETLAPLIQEKSIRQINRSLTRSAGTVRGLHYQLPPFAETKIVSCLKGRVWDIAVDLREGSPTFLSYHAVELSEDNHQLCLIPEGFAHGFQTLTQDCEILYFHTADYNPNFEIGLNALDPNLAISWPKPIAYRSQSDTSYPFLSKDFTGLEV
jgi:dTDP-4-dehydrorhamnose 3,5-epimerase